MHLYLIRKIFLTLYFLFPALGFSQLSFLPINADYAAFHMNDSLAYVEFYVSFFRNNLQYYTINDTLKSSFKTSLKIEYNDSLYYKNSHTFVNIETDSTKMHFYDNFLDIYAVALPFHQFIATITLTDLYANTSGEFLLDLNIPGASDHFTLSDIELSSSIKKQVTQNKYTKNHIEVIPHPRSTFNVLHPMLYFYVELNNLSMDKGKKDTYDFIYYITDQNADTVKSSKLKTTQIFGVNQVEIGGFNALSLPNGVYFLNIHAKDNTSHVTSNVRKKFYVYKPHSNNNETTSVKSSESYIDPVFRTMSGEELRHELDIIQYIADQNEQDISQQLDSVSAISKFLTEFWNKRDKSSGSSVGESRRHYLSMVEEANERFGHGGKAGWRTDRGRVMLTYGRPDDIENHPNTLSTKPYVIWKYNKLEGGCEFVFYDRTGFDNFELIHSTYYKEIHNPNWEAEINNSSSK